MIILVCLYHLDFFALVRGASLFRSGNCCEKLQLNLTEVTLGLRFFHMCTDLGGEGVGGGLVTCYGTAVH